MEVNQKARSEIEKGALLKALNDRIEEMNSYDLAGLARVLLAEDIYYSSDSDTFVVWDDFEKGD